VQSCNGWYVEIVTVADGLTTIVTDAVAVHPLQEATTA
jgi:hypothetical protein